MSDGIGCLHWLIISNDVNRSNLKIKRSFWTVVALALVVATGVRLFGVSVLTIPGAGERPVFEAGDRVLVNRTTYGLRFPKVFGDGYRRWGEKKVSRGDWVAFDSPADIGDTLMNHGLFVGICFAAPGDSVWTDREGRVYNSKPKGVGALKAVEMPRRDAWVAITSDNIRWYELMINRHEGVRAVIIGDSLCVAGHFVRSFCFKHDYYWMASARTDNHADSRAFGFVPFTHIVGKLTRVLYSWDSDAPWYCHFRTERFFMRVTPGFSDKQ